MFEESPGKSRSIFKTQASIYDEAILRKKLMTFYFPKKSPSKMLDSVLKRSLKIMKFSRQSSGGANHRDCYNA